MQGTSPVKFELDWSSDDEPEITVSHSQLGSWDRCRFAWNLAYVENWTSKEKPLSLEIGSLYHQFIAIHYKNPGIDTTSLREKLIFDSLSNVGHSGDAIEIAQRAGWLAKRYIEDYAPIEDQGWKILGVEQPIEVILISPKGRVYKLVGYYDLLVQVQNRIWLVDHKTYERRPYSPIEVLMDTQFPTYMAILKAQGIDVFGCIFNMANRYAYKDPAGVEVEKLFRREYTYRTDVELENCLIEVGKQVDDILDNKNNIRRSLKRECSYCWFQEPCLLSMKGMNIDEVMEGNFVKKQPKSRKN